MKIEIKLHDNSTIFENMDNYNPEEVSAMLNSENGALMVVLGKTVISKHTIRMVRPAEEEVLDEAVTPEENTTV